MNCLWIVLEAGDTANAIGTQLVQIVFIVYFPVRVLSEEEKDYSFFVPICTTTNSETLIFTIQFTMFNLYLLCSSIISGGYSKYTGRIV